MVYVSKIIIINTKSVNDGEKKSPAVAIRSSYLVT
jgi:hypothetical protein